ncbi:MAG: carboxypeptidase regulatory-like domain-containing protein [Candidatus Eremiobacteraeota bacterium]|nr:carboxypeptidase regulatory-like domain-containing protein [Candidatus Eremiobacteraeota bacterium]
MKIARALLVVLLAVFMTACQDDQLPPSAKYAIVKGVVIDSLTSAPVANATVTVDSALVTHTGSDGSFTIANVPSGAVDYAVVAEGYRNFNDSITVEPSSTATLTVKLLH